MQDEERARLHRELDMQSGGSSDPFASAVRTTRMPMVITDPHRHDNPIVFCNDAFCAMTGYGRDDILGRNCRFLQGAATRGEDVAQVRDAIASRRSVQIDLLNHRKDGSTFWNGLLISPVFDGEDLTYFFASQLDVTDRKRAEEHRFLLNRELDHRVKNTLATVQSVVLQTLRSASVPQHVASAVAGRIQALARSHDVMTAEAWASADLRDVVKGALEPLRQLAGDRISVDGPDVRIKPRIATMLSLALHEMGDNAVRHGSLAVSKGRVDIAWALSGDRLLLTWTEGGGAPVVASVRRGYGTRIIETVIAAELNAKVDLDFRVEGLTMSIDAPVADIGVEATEWRMGHDL